MNAEEKAKQQRMIVQNLAGIDTTVKELVVTKNAFQAKLNDLIQHGTQTYSADYVSKAIANLKADMAAKMAAADADMQRRLEELRGLLHERDCVLDLSNPALTNALSLIATIGSGLTFADAQKINANFLHDQSALQALQAAYKSKGVANPGNVEALIYDGDAAIENLKKRASDAILRDSSMNFFASMLAKVAKLEGLTIESLPDEQGAMDAIRAAAGLSARVPSAKNGVLG